MKSHWFKRLERELPSISSNLRMRRVGLGFWRIYFKQAYIHEVYEEMPEVGYDIVAYDPRLEKQSYFEKYEDHPELVRKIKNYVEGYRESSKRIRMRVWLFHNNSEFYERAKNAYKQVVIK